MHHRDLKQKKNLFRVWDNEVIKQKKQVKQFGFLFFLHTNVGLKSQKNYNILNSQGLFLHYVSVKCHSSFNFSKNNEISQAIGALCTTEADHSTP